MRPSLTRCRPAGREAAATYLAAAAAVVGLVSLYIRSLLGGWRKVAPLTGTLTGTLTGLYAYLYTLLVAEDHSLLLGAVGMLVVPAAVMDLTRNLDWWSLRFERARRAERHVG